MCFSEHSPLIVVIESAITSVMTVLTIYVNIAASCVGRRYSYSVSGGLCLTSSTTTQSLIGPVMLLITTQSLIGPFMLLTTTQSLIGPGYVNNYKTVSDCLQWSGTGCGGVSSRLIPVGRQSMRPCDQTALQAI